MKNKQWIAKVEFHQVLDSILLAWLWNFYKLIQRFRVTSLFTGQYTTGYYGTFKDVD